MVAYAIQWFGSSHAEYENLTIKTKRLSSWSLKHNLLLQEKKTVANHCNIIGYILL